MKWRRFGLKTELKWNKNQWIIILLVGVLLIVLAIPTKEREEEEPPITVHETEKGNSKEYEKTVERRLEQTLREVDGVGEVKVMVTFQSSSEKVIEKDREKNSQVVAESDKQGGKRETKEVRSSEATVYQNEAGGEETPYVIKEVNPKVEGIVVIAEGGENAAVVKNITEAIQALFDVDTHKIKVMKRNQTK